MSKALKNTATSPAPTIQNPATEDPASEEEPPAHALKEHNASTAPVAGDNAFAKIIAMQEVVKAVDLKDISSEMLKSVIGLYQEAINLIVTNQDLFIEILKKNKLTDLMTAANLIERMTKRVGVRDKVVVVAAKPNAAQLRFMNNRIATCIEAESSVIEDE